MRLGYVLGVACVCVVAAGGAWYFAGAPMPWRHEADADTPKPLGIHVARARQAPVRDEVAYTATVTSPQIAELHPRVSGTIMRRPFLPGSPVQKGDLLFLIDPRPFEASLAEHTAQRAQAAAASEFARQEVERFRPLARSGFASQEKLQQQQRDQGTAAAQVNEADARIMRDNLDIDYSRVNAPFTGQAGITNFNVGDLAVADQSELVSLAQLDPIQIQVALSSADVVRVRAALAGGQRPDIALLGADGEPNGRFAEITEFDNQYNPRTARLLVRASLPNPDRSLAPGDFLHVRLRLQTEQRLLVPTEALSYRLNQTFVYVVADGKVQPKVVQGTQQHGTDTIITDGLQPGDLLAVDHLGRLDAGTAVRFDEAAPEPDPPGQETVAGGPAR